jgi:hypothetical protein
VTLARRAVETACPPFRVVWNADMLDAVAAFWIRSGDTGRPLVVLLKNTDGSDPPIPAGSTCRFTMVQQQTGHVVTGAAALAAGPTAGSYTQATYPFSNSADTAEPGDYDATWLVTYPSPATSVAAGSDGATLPQAVVNVTSTEGFPFAGSFTEEGTGDVVAYAGTTPTSFTGCVGGTGTMTLGDAVLGAPLSETFPTRGGGVGAFAVQTSYVVSVVRAPGDAGLSGS